MPRQDRPRILLADDAIVCAALTRLLEPDFEVIGSVPDGRALVAAATECDPDVVLLEIWMPVLSGLEAARQISAFKQGCPRLVFVTMHADVAFMAASFRAGGSAYVLKQSPPSELATALEEVLNGRRYISPALANGLRQDFLNNPGRMMPELSQRQRQVLRLVAEGKTAKEIAGILDISPKTVEFHKGLIMKKLNLHNTADMTRHALVHGLAGPGTRPIGDGSLPIAQHAGHLPQKSRACVGHSKDDSWRPAPAMAG